MSRYNASTALKTADGYARTEALVECSLRERRRGFASVGGGWLKWAADGMNGEPTDDTHVSHRKGNHDTKPERPSCRLDGLDDTRFGHGGVVGSGRFWIVARG